jgi:hypothetical protein
MICLRTKCFYCDTELIHPWQEFNEDLAAAVEWSKKYNHGRNVVIACPSCTKRDLKAITSKPRWPKFHVFKDDAG